MAGPADDTSDAVSVLLDAAAALQTARSHVTPRGPYNLAGVRAALDASRSRLTSARASWSKDVSSLRARTTVLHARATGANAETSASIRALSERVGVLAQVAQALEARTTEAIGHVGARVAHVHDTLTHRLSAVHDASNEVEAAANHLVSSTAHSTSAIEERLGNWRSRAHGDAGKLIGAIAALVTHGEHRIGEVDAKVSSASHDRLANLEQAILHEALGTLAASTASAHDAASHLGVASQSGQSSLTAALGRVSSSAHSVLSIIQRLGPLLQMAKAIL